ncbi:protein FAR1-RELATED SEQUENCE 6-like [Silene latifolia]|uniref:protein FAR1-RELATED SEQUENCE 6-like n=1 Tax=Silene latifolia TaxID=37657 RepID=UPI003D77CA2E
MSDEGIQFYETYAIACGFEPRKSSTKRFRSSGDIRTKLIVCHREGFRDSKPIILPITAEEEEPMVKAYYSKKTKVTRIGCKARIFFKFVIKEIDQVQVPLLVVDQFHAAHNHLFSPLKSVKEYVDGYENIGACLTDFKNFGREIKCLIGLKDAQMFQHVVTRLKDAQMFVDFVTRLNSVVWDSDLEPSDFEEKWCMLISEFQLEDNAWLKYLFSKRQSWIPAYYRDIPLGCLLRTTQRFESKNNFFKRLENPHGTLVEFWMRFQSVMDQQRHTLKSLDRDSDHSLPQTKTLLSLEVHASTVYTHALFYEFQQQCVDSLNSCSAGDSSREGSTRFLDVEDSIFHKTYTVAFNPTTFDATCSCKMFERKGYICKHII